MTDQARTPTTEELAKALRLHAYDLVNGGTNASELRRDLNTAASALLAAGEAAETPTLKAAFVEGFHAGANMAGTLSAEECWPDSLIAASLSPAVPPQEPALNHGDVRDWKTAALIFGESLASVGPTGYYAFTPQQWLDWARRVTATPAPEPHPAPSQNATSAAPSAQSAARADGRAGTSGRDVQ